MSVGQATCSPARAQRGETLAGLLVGMALGLLVLAAGAHMLAQLLRNQRVSLQESHLQQDLHFALEVLTRELADAQYSALAWSSRSPGACEDDFCDGPEDFSIGNARLDWSLDRNHNGRQDNDECTGWRLRSGALQMRTACAPEVWTALTDTTSLRITRLQARIQCVNRSGWLQRSLWLQIEASRPGDFASPLALQRRVPLRNPLPQAVQTRYCP